MFAAPSYLRRSHSQRKVLGGIVVVVAIVAAVGVWTAASPPFAQAYWTSSNWYSTSWFLNRGETLQWAQARQPVVAGAWSAALPFPVKVAVSGYWWSFNWIARYAYNHGRCLRITWIYVNLPYPDQWWGPGC